MYEPKAVDLLTTNGKHILIYDYLVFPITVMLANDIVVGINPEADEIAIMVPNEDYVYDDITHINTAKPTRGNVKIDLSASNLKSIQKFKQGKFYEQELFRDPFLSLLLDYYKR